MLMEDTTNTIKNRIAGEVIAYTSLRSHVTEQEEDTVIIKNVHANQSDELVGDFGHSKSRDHGFHAYVETKEEDDNHFKALFTIETWDGRQVFAFERKNT
jgi:hypothetical protein